MSTVVVTGGGGSIGTVLCQQLVDQGHRVVAVDISELNLFNLEQKLGDKGDYFLCDVRDYRTLWEVFKQVKPTAVYHAAALKQVPILQTQFNAIEAIRTNVMGTHNVLMLAARADAQDVTLISTDKAVNPISVMGATKKIAEKLVWDHDYVAALFGKKTTFRVVRFGNVVGSAGSVFPLWERQWQDGRPITLTDKGMMRYLMSIDQAVQLVIEGQELPQGTYVLDMGELVNMYDQAQEFLRHRIVGDPVDDHIELIGIRPGEKLIEELYDQSTEMLVPTPNPRINQIKPSRRAHIGGDLFDLKTHIQKRDFPRVVSWIKYHGGYQGDELLCYSL